MYYWYMGMNLVNTSNRVKFYEGMNYIEILNPNSIQLWIILGRPLPEDQEELSIVVPPTLDSQHTPFPMIYDVTVRVICDHDTLGIILGC